MFKKYLLQMIVMKLFQIGCDLYLVVVDSQDISLNISREMLQNNPIITKIKKGITTKILNELSIFC